MNWNKQIQHNEVIEKNDSEKWMIQYQHMQKIPIPMVDQRDLILKAYPRKNYLLSTTGGEPIHIVARQSVEHPSKPAGAVSGFTRANQGLGGFKIEQTSNGCRMTVVNQTNLNGSIPQLIINQAGASAPKQLYDQLGPYAKQL